MVEASADGGDEVLVEGLLLRIVEPERDLPGGPAVVFLAGAGAMGLDYLLAHERIVEFTTSIIYDRSGTGWSEDAVLPRSLDEVTDELRALLRAVDVPPPYVLVDHSLGGAYTQRYDVPLIVLSGTAVGDEQTMLQSEENLREQIAGSQRLFDAITVAAPHGEHRALSDASHVSIPMVRPDAVADAARDLLSRLTVVRT